MPLFNIFKTRKKKDQSISLKPKIIIDSREKNSLVPSSLIELGSEIEYKQLEIGDYLIENIVVERKTFSDFIGSMLNRRLIEQLKNMLQYESRILIIEGKLKIQNQEESKLNPNSIKGMILSSLLDFNTPIIFTKDENETAIYLFLLAKRQLKPKTELSLHSRIPKTKHEQKKYILESFPNIGPKTSEKLLKEFSSLSNVFNASEEDLSKIIKNKAKPFKELLED